MFKVLNFKNLKMSEITMWFFTDVIQIIFKYCINCIQSDKAQQETVIRCIHMIQSVEIMENGKTGLPDLIHCIRLQDIMSSLNNTTFTLVQYIYSLIGLSFTHNGFIESFHCLYHKLHLFFSSTPLERFEKIMDTIFGF